MINGWPLPSGEKERRRKQRREREVKKHKELDDKEIDKIEEDRHEVNTKRNTVWPMTVKCWILMQSRLIYSTE